MHKAMDVALDTDLRPFIALLQSRGVIVRVTEEVGHQAVWAHNVDEAIQVRAAWQAYQAGELLPLLPSATGVLRRVNPVQPVRYYPFTMLVLLACLLVFVMAWLLQDWRWLAALSFEPLLLRNGQVVGLQGFAAGWQAGEYWRALTPVFLHFGILHLVFNGLWWWELGRRLERRNGALLLALLLVFSGVFSNACQYLAGRWLADPGLFGGLSGVIYALIGYIAVWNRLRPAQRYDVPPGLVAIMLGFLLVCMTGVMEWVGLGRVANAAHVGGLLAGGVWGLGVAWFTGRQHGYR